MSLLASVLNSHCMSFSDFQFVSFALKKDTCVQFPNEITEGRDSKVNNVVDTKLER